MRHRRPEARGVDARGGDRRVHDADDAGRALVARPLEAEPLDEPLSRREAGDRNRARVRDVREQRAERDDRAHAEHIRHLAQRAGVGLPAQRRLNALDEHEVAVRAGDLRGLEDVFGPVDRARASLDEAHGRADGGEVVEVLRVDARDRLCVERLDEELHRGRGRLAGVVPAPEGTDHDRFV